MEGGDRCRKEEEEDVKTRKCREEEDIKTWREETVAGRRRMSRQGRWRPL